MPLNYSATLSVGGETFQSAANDLNTILNDINAWANGNVANADLAGSISGSKLLDGAVTAAKLAAAAPGRQVSGGYADSTTVFGTSSTSFVDITGMAITITGDGSTAIWLEFYCPVVVNYSSTSTTRLYNSTDATVLQESVFSVQNMFGLLRVKVSAFSGSKTFKVQAKVDANITEWLSPGMTMYLRATWDG